ncbi:MAG: NADH-quinone oxidoreductase subunit A [Verrucomicrobia bacterium]|nr:NADH-quinone oxidoreductase subunit A [Verrucomicrobiota bacterium]
MSPEFNQYLPIGMLIIVAIAFSAGLLAMSTLMGQKGRRPAIKDTAYECGMLPITAAHTRFSVKFYVVAMLFVLFDIEVVFLYPWAVVFKSLLKDPQTGAAAFFSMLAFVGVLFVGFVYALRKGAFDWGARRES